MDDIRYGLGNLGRVSYLLSNGAMKGMQGTQEGTIEQGRI